MEKPLEIIESDAGAAKKKLTLSQRMRIHVRRHMLKKRSYLPPLILSMVLIIAMLLISFFPIHTPNEPMAEEYPNTGFQLSFVGDVMLGRYIGIYGEKFGYDSYFSSVSPIWSNSDYVIANLESSVLLGEEGDYEKDEKNIHLYSTPNAVLSLLNNGINAITFANNHSHDYGMQAFLEATAFFDDIGLNYSGTTTKVDDRGEKILSTTLTCADGTNVCFIGVTNVIYEGLGTGSGVLTSGNGGLYSAILESKTDNVHDLTVVYVHWGKEYNTLPSNAQVEMAHKLVDAGADIVIGSHSHCLQPIEKYGNGIIFYSLGNFIMDQNNTFTRDSVIVQYNKSADGRRYFEIIPLRITDGVPAVTTDSFYCARIRTILTKFLHHSEYEVDSSGRIIIEY